MTSRVSSRWSGLAVVALTTSFIMGCGQSSSGSDPESETSAQLAADAEGASVAGTPSSGGDIERSTVNHNASKPPGTRSSDAGTTSEIRIPAEFAGIKLAPMGRRVVRSSLADSPGYVPLPEEDIRMVEEGRREAPYVEGEELGPEYHSSGEALARRIIDLVNTGDWRTLYDDLFISFDEYKTFCWPEFPSSRPSTGYEPEDAWQFHWKHAMSGAKRGVSGAAKDIPLSFDHLAYEVGLVPFRNFLVFQGVRIHAETADGRPVVLDFADAFIERHGRWKVYIYKD